MENKKLEIISMTELYDTSYPPRQAIIKGLLYNGIYLFVGAPKTGKSFFMAQLSYHVATGLELWGYPVKKGTVLYLALEDDYGRLQRRLSTMFGVEGTENLFFSVQANSLNGGLFEQMQDFLQSHTDTQLIIIDTLQKVRELQGDNYSYSKDYEIMGRLKGFADRHHICLLIVHHTRKLSAEDTFDTISGTNGLLGAADGAFVLSKRFRTGNEAILNIVGRDQDDQVLTLEFDRQKCLWRLLKAEVESHKLPPNPLLEAVSEVLDKECQRWLGTPTELLALLPECEMSANVLTRNLNILADRLWNEYHIRYENHRKHEGRTILLECTDKLRDDM